MPERVISRTHDAETTMAVLEDIGGNEMGFMPIREIFSAEGGKGQRAAYEVAIPYGLVMEFFLGAGSKREPVITTLWPSGRLEILASRRALRYIGKEVRRYNARVESLVELLDEDI